MTEIVVARHYVFLFGNTLYRIFTSPAYSGKQSAAGKAISPITLHNPF
jgi:hypothetical protein